MIQSRVPPVTSSVYRNGVMEGTVDNNQAHLLLPLLSKTHWRRSVLNHRRKGLARKQWAAYQNHPRRVPTSQRIGYASESGADRYAAPCRDPRGTIPRQSLQIFSSSIFSPPGSNSLTISEKLNLIPTPSLTPAYIQRE